MSDYAAWYEKWLSRLGSRQQLAKRLQFGNRWLTGLMYLLYPILLVSLWLSGQWSAVSRSFWIPATGFCLVSLWRRWSNQPRPYEMWEIKPLLTRDGSGCSMPSRHVFSATIIGMAVCSVHAWLGLICLLVAVLLGLIRILGGLHYVKDVVVGFTLGILWGILFWL